MLTPPAAACEKQPEPRKVTRAELERIQSSAGLSRDVSEIVERVLA